MKLRTKICKYAGMTKRIPILWLVLVMCLSFLAASSLADPAEHEHDYTAGWKFFQTPAEAAGFASIPGWNPSMSHGMVAKCACGATNSQYNVWTEAHHFDENGICTKCGYEQGYTVSVQYSVPDGYTALQSVSKTGAAGTEYSFQSPAIEGLMPDQTAVSGTIGSADENYTVNYTEAAYTVTVHYTVPEGYDAPAPQSITDSTGTAYNLESPVVPDLKAERNAVTGTIGDHDESFTVAYSEIRYVITVEYEVPAGVQAPERKREIGAPGMKYQFESPPIAGLVPDKDEVKGQIGASDETITVTYYAETHTVTVNYTAPEGFNVPASVSKSGKPGTEYSFESPAVEGLVPDQATVSGSIGSADETKTVTYSEGEHTVTVKYVVPDGYDKPNDKSITFRAGTAYSFTSPDINHLMPNQAVVSGLIGHTDETITVTYAEAGNTVTVDYHVPSGYTRPAPHIMTGRAGSSYSYQVPELEGLEADTKVVSGTFGETDSTVWVTYTPIRYYTATARHINEYGDEMYTPRIKQGLKSGDSYTFDYIPTSNFRPDQSRISGSILDHDEVVTFTYSHVTSNTEWHNGSGECTHPADKIEEYDPRYDGAHYHMVEQYCTQCRASRNKYRIPCTDADGNGFCDSCAQNLGERDDGYTLTVNYVVPDGYPKPETVTKKSYSGSQYFIQSPTIPGIVPDKAIVQGSFSSDTTITVTYYVPRSLRIHYVFPEGYPKSRNYDQVLYFKSGDSYQVSAPAASDLAPSPGAIRGTMGNQDVDVTVEYYYNQSVTASYYLTINYVVPEGFTAPDQMRTQVPSGNRYNIESPYVNGLYCTRPCVTGTMGNADQTVTVEYKKTVLHRLTVNYNVPALYSEQVPETYTAEMLEGDSYSVSSPKITGLYADTSVVQGTMGDRDVTVDVTYKEYGVAVEPQEYTLTINYVVMGGTGHMEYYQVKAGAMYYYPTPAMDHKKPDREYVSGLMPEGNQFEEVTYSPAWLLTINYTYPEDYTGPKQPTYSKLYCQGEKYKVRSPHLVQNGLDCGNLWKVEGTMGTQDVTVNVVYSWLSAKLTVDYTFPDNYTGEKPETHTQTLRFGQAYNVPSPQYEHLTPSINTVHGNMGGFDIKVTVAYEWTPHTLTVNFTYPENYTGARQEPYVRTVGETQTYRYFPRTSISTDGGAMLVPIPGALTGTMGTEDITETVEYRWVHTLTINYTFPEAYFDTYGGTAPAPDVRLYAEGEKYSIRSPDYQDLVPVPLDVEGTMGTEDQEAWVEYDFGHTLTVNFTFPEGYAGEKPETHTEKVRTHDPVHYEPPKLEGMIAEPALIEYPEMGMADRTETVNYRYDKPRLTVTFTFPAEYFSVYGGEPPATVVEYYEEGEAYRVPLPAYTELIPSPPVVDGFMGAEDLDINVTYDFAHKLTVNFTFPADYQGEKPGTYVGYYRTHEPVRYEPPKVTELKPEPAVIEYEEMGYQDRTVTVTYKPCNHEGTGRTYEKIGNISHMVLCAACGAELGNEEHEWGDMLYNETDHWRFCSICQSGYFEEPHNIFYISFIDVHDVVCYGCGWRLDNVPHTFVKESEEGGVIIEKCVCGRTRKVYPVTGGENQTVTKPENRASVHIEANHEKFEDRVECDGKVLTPGEDFHDSDGSTVIELTQEFLSKLFTGDHTLTVHFDDGVAISTFTTTYKPVFGPATFTLPAAIKTVEAGAFEGNPAISVVYVPDTCTSVGANAFKDCTGLRQIRLPKNCAIDDSAFDGCTGPISIFAPAGGTTKTWADKNKIPFVAE